MSDSENPVTFPGKDFRKESTILNCLTSIITYRVLYLFLRPTDRCSYHSSNNPSFTANGDYYKNHLDTIHIFLKHPVSIYKSTDNVCSRSIMEQ